MKRIVCLLLVLCMMVSLAGCVEEVVGSAVFLFLVATGDDRADKEDIFTFVCENEADLLAAINSGDFSDFENKGFIQDINPEEAAVEFSCGGFGVGSGTSYVGFYYSPNGDMNAVWCAPPSPGALKPSGKGFLWQEPNGDNRYYTEHICGNFYYYEASF